MESSQKRALSNMKRDCENKIEEAEKMQRHKIDEVERKYIVQLEESATKADEAKLAYHSKLTEAKEKYTMEINRVGVYCIVFAKQRKKKPKHIGTRTVFFSCVHWRKFVGSLSCVLFSIGEDKMQTVARKA